MKRKDSSTTSVPEIGPVPARPMVRVLRRRRVLRRPKPDFLRFSIQEAKDEEATSAKRLRSDTAATAESTGLQDLVKTFKQLTFHPPKQKEVVQFCAKTKLWFRPGKGLDAHQLDMLEFMHARPGGIIWAAVGLGKTRVGIVFCLQMAEKRPAIVIVPKTLQKEWVHELTACFGNNVRFAIYSNQSAAELAVLNICIVSYDALLLAPPHFFKVEWSCALADESQKICNAKTRWFVKMQEISSTRKFCLTATPRPNKVKDVHTQLAWAIGPTLVATRSHAQLLMYIHAVTYPDTEVKLPEATFLVKNVELDKDTRALYSRVEESDLCPLLKGTIKRQLTAAPFVALKSLEKYGLDSPWVHDFKGLAGLLSPKMRELHKNLLLFPTDQILVYATLAEVLHLAHHLVADAAVLDGSCSTAERFHIIQRFKSGKLRVLFITYPLGAVGLNFQNCHVVILIDEWWTESTNSQASGRVIRVGQKHKVTVIRLQAVDTIDDHVHEKAAEKGEQMIELLNDVRKLRDESPQ